MAFHTETIDAIGQRISCHRHHRALWATIATLTALLLTARWAVDGIPTPIPLLGAAASGSMIIGAALVVALALHWPRAGARLQTRPYQWLGTRSFSLYLVHEPVVVTLTFLLPATTTPWVILATAPALAIGAAAVFYRYVEAPAHRLAKAVGNHTKSRSALATEPSA